MGSYSHPHTVEWSPTIASFDGFVMVTPEYNHSFPAPLKNALDYLYREWQDKSVGFVSYGLDGGVRAVEQLRPVCAAGGPGEAHLHRASGGPRGRFQLEAAAQAVHVDGARTGVPDHQALTTLTTALDRVAHAGREGGPGDDARSHRPAGLTALGRVQGRPGAERFQPYGTARGHLLSPTGRQGEAAQSLETAMDHRAPSRP